MNAQTSFAAKLALLVLLAFERPAAAQTVSPDAVFPCAYNRGAAACKNVNLFTGNVNYAFPLATVKSAVLDFALTASYNSQSVYQNNHYGTYQPTALGGYGWKLLDYPKVAVSNGTYYLLDGYQQLPLQLASQQNGTYTYKAAGNRYRWNLQRTGTGTANDRWTVVNESGNSFWYRAPGVVSGAGTVWSFSSLVSLNGVDSLQFSYAGNGSLTSIRTALGDAYSLSYGALGSQVCLTGITHAKAGYVLDKAQLSYQQVAVQNATYYLLSSVRFLQALAPMNLYGSAAPALSFGYGGTALGENAGALTSIADPVGGTLQFTYQRTTGPGAVSTYPVVQLAQSYGYDNNSGDTLNPYVYSTVSYDTGTVVPSPDGAFAQYNAVSVFPGSRYQRTNQAHPYGSIEYDFFNGQPAAALRHFPADCDSSVAHSPAVLGCYYESRTKTDTMVAVEGAEVTSQTFYWEPGTLSCAAQTVYPRLSRSVSTVYGVAQWHAFDYDPCTGVVLARRSSRNNPSVGSASQQQDSVVVFNTYAFQQYPALQALNVVDKVARTVTTVQTAGSNAWDTTDCHVTQWTQWSAAGLPSPGSGAWAEWRRYDMLSATANTATGFGPAPAPTGWLKTDDVLRRNAWLQVAGALDRDSLASYTVYPSPNAGVSPQPVATFSLADPYAQQCFYYGFEPYESIPVAQLGQVAPSQTAAHTGSSSLQVQAFGQSINTVAGPVPYLLSFWMRTSGSQNTSVSISAGSTTLFQGSAGPTAGAWRYFQASVTPPAGAAQLRASISNPANAVLIDDIRFGPAQAPFSATVYDQGYRTATLGTNGETNVFIRNVYKEVIAQAGPDSSRPVASWNAFYNSVSGNAVFNNGTGFNPAQPNASLNLATATGGIWEGFGFDSTAQFPPGNLQAMSIGNGLLSCNGTPAAPGVAQYAQPLPSGTFLVSAEFLPNNLVPGQETGFFLQLASGGTSQGVRLVMTPVSIRLYNAQTGVVYDSIPIRTVPATVPLAMEVLMNNHVFVYLGGQFLFDYMFEGGTLGGATGIYSTNTYGYADNYFLLQGQLLSLNTYDAAMRPVQSLIRQSDTSLLATETLYGDALAQEMATTQSVTVTTTDLGLYGDSCGVPMQYIPQLAQFNAWTLQVDTASLLAKTFGYTNPFQVSRQYEKSPRALPLTSGSGGAFSANVNGTNYQYGTNADSAGFTPGTLLSNSATNPDALTRIETNSTAGLTYSDLQAGGGDTLTTAYSYDQNLRQTKTYQPTYFEAGKSKAFVSTTRYSYAGSPTGTSSPDAGTSAAIYTLDGDLAFRADAAAMHAGQVYYTLYDRQDHVAEEGYYLHAWTADTLQLLANAHLQPAWPKQWVRRYGYNGANTGPSLGRLTLVTANLDADTAPEVIETLQYSLSGNIVQHSLQLPGADTATYRIGYRYDLLNRPVQLDYSNGTSVTYTYNQSGQIASVGKPGNPAYYATYAYQDTVLLEGLHNNGVQRTFDLNQAGWIDNIRDPFLTDSITYTSGGLANGDHGQTGYYSGLIGSVTTKYHWPGAPAAYTYRYKYDAFGQLTAGYISETDQNDLNYAVYDENGNIQVLQRWKDKTVFWSSAGGGQQQISEARITAMAQPFDTVGTGTATMAGMALAPGQQQLYWINSQGGLVRARFDGSQQVTLPVALPAGANAVAVDAQHGYLFVSSAAASSILRCNLDGTGAVSLVAGYKPTNIAADASTGEIYWPNVISGVVTLVKATQNGSGIQSMYTLPPASAAVTGFAIDTLRNTLWWASKTAIFTAPQSGAGPVQTVYAGGTAIQQLSLDIFNKKVFWTDTAGGRIMSLHFDGTDTQTVLAGLRQPQWICQNLLSNIYQYSDTSNQLLATLGQQVSFGYDAAGRVNQTSALDTLLYYPLLNRTAAIQAGNQSFRFLYNMANERIFQTYNDTTLLYLTGAGGQPLETRMQAPGQALSGISYVYGPTGLISYNYNGQDYFVLKDHLGSVRVILDSANQYVANLDYTPFGELMTDVSNPGTGQAPPLLFRYTGQEYSSGTGLYNYHARLYDPATGRYYAPDPAGQYPSPYVYAGNNPILNNDPTGAWSWSGVAKMAGGAVVGIVGTAVAGVGVGLMFTPFVVVGGALTAVGLGVAYGGVKLIESGYNTEDPPLPPLIDKSTWTPTHISTTPHSYEEEDKERQLPMDPNALKCTTILKDGQNTLPEDGLYIFVYRIKSDDIILRRNDRGLCATAVCREEPTKQDPTGREPGRYIHVRHTQLNGGWSDVWGAGELQIKNGHIAQVNNRSGHFKPESRTLDYVEAALRAWKIPLASDVTFNTKELICAGAN